MSPTFVSGLGFGLIYLPAIVSVTCWFKKKRSLATGIAVAGSGLGTFIFSPLTDYLVREYGWRGALLLIAGLVLQCTTFGALFRPVEEDTSAKIEEPTQNGKTQNIQLRQTLAPIQRPLSVGNLPPPLQNNADSAKLTASLGCLARPLPPSAEPSALRPPPYHSHQTLRSRGHSSGIMNRSDVLYCGSFQNLPHDRSVRYHHEVSTLAF